MKKITFITFLLISTTWFSCVSKKEISKETTKNDSIQIQTNKVRIDTIYKERIVQMFEPIYNEVEIPCDTAKLKQTLLSGKNSLQIKKEKGIVKIVFKKDSSSLICENKYKVLLRQNDSLKSIKSTLNQAFSKEVVKKPFFANIWQILFFIVLVLWAFGITPRFIFKLITKV